ncbi:flavodoxin domain-containing protein [Haliangium sp.]|uniref:flavodoxin domain-containing protein n=1 Tax=Haliangium sp. TaxID=2663208 RepID=UPI003D143BF9
MRILITYGSKRGGTHELARTVGDVLTASGHEVDLRSPHGLEDLGAWDAVIVGGAVYAGRWYRPARRFVQRHVDELRRMPVWLFSSGPIGAEVRDEDFLPTTQVRRLMKLVDARGHITFGGRLAPDPKGLIAQAMAKNGFAGDWRDFDQVRTWAHEVAATLDQLPARSVPVPAPHLGAHRPIRRLLAGLCLFTGLTALAGGLELMMWHDGAAWLPPLDESLRHTPFVSFFVPGLLLLAVVGVSNLIGGSMAVRRHRWAEYATFFGGAVITGWIVSEMLLMRTVHWLQLIYLVVGLVTMAAALWLQWSRRTALSQRPSPARQAHAPAPA